MRSSIRRSYTISDRAAFVKRVCGGDKALRRELPRLLGLVESSGEFLESPAIHIAAPVFRHGPPKHRTRLPSIIVAVMSERGT